MSERVIDYDRGVIIQSHHSGMDVFMYVDTPGVFLTAHGKDVSEQIAAEAGYDVAKLMKERIRRERIDQATKLISKELEDEKDLVENVVEEREGWKLVSTGLGRHNVVDPDGNILNRSPLVLDSAKRLFDGMAPAVVVASDDEKDKNKKK